MEFNNLQNIMKSPEYNSGIQTWSEPPIFKLNSPQSEQMLEDLFSKKLIARVVDNIDSIADDLFELKNPADKDNEESRRTHNQEVYSQGLSFGSWVYFPWSHYLVRYPDKDDLRALRTSRNRALITSAEQEKLYESTIAVFGLSVGSNIVERLVSSGIGGKLIIGDMDVIQPSNLNRINTSFQNVGSKKVHDLAKKISEIDPYIEQVHLLNGVSQAELDSVVSNNLPSIIIDEIDDLPMKVRLRRYAKEKKIPLIMATDVGDKALIDVERYDLDQLGTKAFNGKIKQESLNKLLRGEITKAEKSKLLLKIVGLRNTTPRLVQSAMQQGSELSGLPQLGTTAAHGGVLVAIAIREIVLGRDLNSGRFIGSPKKILELDSPTPLKEGIKTLGKFALQKNQD